MVGHLSGFAQDDIALAGGNVVLDVVAAMVAIAGP
jgi:hypothetical protein